MPRTDTTTTTTDDPTISISELVRLEDHVTAVSFCPNGMHVAAGSLSGQAVLLGGRRLHEALPVHQLGVLAMAWSPDGATLALGGQDGLVRLWDTSEGRTTAEIHVPGWASSLAWSPGGDVLAVAAGRSVLLIDPDGVIRRRFDDHPATVTAIAWTSGGKRLAAASYGGLWWYGAESQQIDKRFPWKGSVLSIALAPNGKWVATGNQDATVHCWKLWSGEDLQMSGYAAKVEVLDWDRTSRYLAVGTIGEVNVWDFSGRGPQGSKPITLGGHERRITALGHQPGGSLLAAAGADGVLSLWRPAARRRLVERVVVGEELSCLGWHPKGRRLVIGTASGGVFLVKLTER
jgi:WD40 repeat protein